MAAVGAFVAQKALLVVVLAVATGVPPLTTLFSWDAWWYADVISYGYVWPGTHPSPTGMLSNLAFFPLYPFASQGLAAVTGLSSHMALFVVAWACTIAAVLGIHRVGVELGGQAVGLVLVLLWGALPRSIVLLMPYSEPMFIALVAWTLWALLRDRDEGRPRWWLLVGALCCLAGLTRPAVLPLVGTLWLVWLVAVVRARRGGAPRRDAVQWRRLASAALGSAGFVGFWAWVGWRVGDVAGGYFAVQRDWGTALGTPLDTLAHALGLNGDSDLRFTGGVLALLVAATVALVLMVTTREPWLLIAYSGLALALIWCQQGYFQSKARFLLPVFPLLLPLARPLASRRLLAVVVIVVATVASAAWDISLIGSQLAP